MTNAWIEHVKNYRTQNPGMSYKTAMHEAGASYNSGTIQGAGMKDMMRKAKNSANKARKTANNVSQQIDNNKDLINMIAPSAMKKIEQAQKIHAQIENQANEVLGGKFQMNTAIRKTRNTANKVRKTANNVSQQIDNNKNLINMVAPSAMKKIEQAQKIHAQIENQADQIIGGKFQMNRAIRKTKNTVRRVKDIARTTAPILSMVAPEIGIPLTTALAMSGGSLGSARGMNKYRSGGSFLVGGSFTTPGSYGGSYSSSMISPMHPSFNPVKPKPVALRIREN